MTLIRRTSLLDPGATRSFPHGTGSTARIGHVLVGRAVLEAGWRWTTDIGPQVGTPTCQIHHAHVLIRGRFAIQMDGGDYAEFDAGDVFDVPAGHEAWVLGDSPAELLDISGNSGEFGQRASGSRILATLMMTDIVDSTKVAGRLGDTAWRRLLAEHNRIVRGLIERHDGSEVNTTGDGFLATFATAAGAIECGRAVRDAVVEVGVEVRVGIHTGEIEQLHEDIGGIAVHATARIMSLAAPSEVLVSAITRAIAVGMEVEFTPRGTHDLKGIDIPVEVYGVS